MQDSYAVLLPAYDGLQFGPEQQGFFANGGVSALLGCTRAEYVARRMSPERSRREDAPAFRGFAENARDAAGGPVLLAVDYEIGGVHRLHDLGPQIRHPDAALGSGAQSLEAFGREAGLAARALGVNLFLGPVLDILTGPNPWLSDRTLATDPAEVALLTSAFIRGAQSQGIAATAKHFPGHHRVEADPFDDPSITVSGTPDELARGLAPFREAVANGVRAVMTGPVPTAGMDPREPSSTSREVVRVLREDLGFRGLIISDDIDLPGTMRGRPLTEVAVAAINAGVELVLLAGGPQVDEVARALAQAVTQGRIPREKLALAANAVRKLAAELEHGTND